MLKRKNTYLAYAEIMLDGGHTVTRYIDKADDRKEALGIAANFANSSGCDVISTWLIRQGCGKKIALTEHRKIGRDKR